MLAWLGLDSMPARSREGADQNNAAVRESERTCSSIGRRELEHRSCRGNLQLPLLLLILHLLLLFIFILLHLLLLLLLFLLLLFLLLIFLLLPLLLPSPFPRPSLFYSLPPPPSSFNSAFSLSVFLLTITLLPTNSFCFL